LAVCKQALAHGFDAEATRLEKLNYRLAFYIRKAFAEFNLDKKDQPISTIQEALDEVTRFGKVEETKSNRSSFQLYKSYIKLLEDQKTFYLSELHTEPVIEEAEKLIEKGFQANAMQLLEKSVFEVTTIKDTNILLTTFLPVINKLIEITSNDRLRDDAQSYADYLVDCLTSLESNQGILDEALVTELIMNIKSAYGDSKISSSIKALEALRRHDPHNSDLNHALEELKLEETSPQIQLRRINKLMYHGDKKTLYSEIIKQANRFKDELKSDNNALELWLIKARTELELTKPEETINSLQTIKNSQERDEARLMFEGYGSSIAGNLRKAFTAYVYNGPDSALALAKNLLRETKDNLIPPNHLLA